LTVGRVSGDSRTLIKSKDSLTKIKDLRCYESKSKDRGMFSFLVEDIEKHFNHNAAQQIHSPNQTQDNDSSYYDINDMLVLAVSAIKELASHNEQLANKIKVLEQQKDNNQQ
jgi:hypothetical protein